MKNISAKKLSLNKNTVASLNSNEMLKVNGGDPTNGRFTRLMVLPGVSDDNP